MKETGGRYEGQDEMRRSGCVQEANRLLRPGQRDVRWSTCQQTLTYCEKLLVVHFWSDLGMHSGGYKVVLGM